jgi:uncharacterized protein (UPF0276 family)
MLLSINYSHAAASLFQAGMINVDRFKCPAWPDAIAAASEVNDVYVHFPLRVGTGKGDAIDTETGAEADWIRIENFLLATNTPLINLHLGPTIDDYPNIPIDSTNPVHNERITEDLIKDINYVTSKFGASRVVLENVHNGNSKYLRSIFLPEFINTVIDETGCGFLLDLSHAQLSAKHLEVDVYEYTRQLPVGAIREIHVTGIHKFEGHWLEIAREAGFDQQVIDQYTGHYVDHLPMTEGDWEYLGWSVEQIESGKWAEPWTITFEYGGVGGMFAPITDGEVIQRQVPRMYELVKGAWSED